MEEEAKKRASIDSVSLIKRERYFWHLWHVKNHSASLYTYTGKPPITKLQTCVKCSERIYWNSVGKRSVLDCLLISCLHSSSQLFGLYHFFWTVQHTHIHTHWHKHTHTHTHTHTHRHTSAGAGLRLVHVSCFFTGCHGPRMLNLWPPPSGSDSPPSCTPLPAVLMTFQHAFSALTHLHTHTPAALFLGEVNRCCQKRCQPAGF